MKNVQPLSQRDPRWANIKIGQTNLTLGRFGCTITCLAMLMDRTPDVLARSLRYTSDGKVFWSSDFSPIKFEFRDYIRNDGKIIECLANPHRAAILEVDNGSHWVLPLIFFPPDRKNPTYLIIDPWDGKYKAIEEYGNNITGAAYFTIG